MGFEYVSKLPTPDEIRAQFPLHRSWPQKKLERTLLSVTSLQATATSFLSSLVRALLTGKMRLLIM